MCKQFTAAKVLHESEVAASTQDMEYDHERFVKFMATYCRGGYRRFEDKFCSQYHLHEYTNILVCVCGYVMFDILFKLIMYSGLLCIQKAIGSNTYWMRAMV